jgi:hypothetical protein
MYALVLEQVLAEITSFAPHLKVMLTFVSLFLSKVKNARVSEKNLVLANLDFFVIVPELVLVIGLGLGQEEI